VKTGPDRPRPLGTWLPAQATHWNTLVAKHGLRQIAMPDLLGESHHYADFCFAHGAAEPPPPAFVSAIKLRQAGFTEVCDTEDMFCYWLRNFIDRGILPRP